MRQSQGKQNNSLSGQTTVTFETIWPNATWYNSSRLCDVASIMATPAIRLFRRLEGMFCVYKPAGVHWKLVRDSIETNLLKGEEFFDTATSPVVCETLGVTFPLLLRQAWLQLMCQSTAICRSCWPLHVPPYRFKCHAAPATSTWSPLPDTARHRDRSAQGTHTASGLGASTVRTSSGYESVMS